MKSTPTRDQIKCISCRESEDVDPMCHTALCLCCRDAFRDQTGRGDRPQADGQRVGRGVEAP